jgi:hypothetical protein
MPTSPGHILVVYALLQYPLRRSLTDHLYALRRHSRFRTSYINLAVCEVPRWMRRARFDAIIFHTSFLSSRWDPETFARVRRRARALLELDAPRIAMPQDEFIHTDALTDFLREAEASHVFSVAPESEWPKIYRGLDPGAVHMHRVLTGYLERETLARIDRALEPPPPRETVVGYRAWEAAIWLGRFGRLKVDIARAFADSAANRGVPVDISTRQEDTIFGEAWYRFLASCRYTIGVEGGASVLDRDGSIRQATERFLATNPDASFAEVERACFPGEDGKLALRAVSPRHLEACATRTCQILVEGDYQGVLRPGEHYLPVSEDLSDVDQVMEAVVQDRYRAELVRMAWADVVGSGRYTYEAFVREIESQAIEPTLSGRPQPAPSAAIHSIEAAALDRASWWLVRRRLGLTPIGRMRAWALRTWPDQLVRAVRGVKDWGRRSCGAASNRGGS